MIRNLVGLLAVAVTLSVGAPALAKEASAKPTQYVTIGHVVAAPAWGAGCMTDHRPSNFEDTTPPPFAERCMSVTSSGHSSIESPIR
jgi:hypothetical protein